MNIFKTKYRIMQTEQKFIVQKKDFLFKWVGIDKTDFYTWCQYQYQFDYCSFDTLEEAKYFLNKYKSFRNKSKVKYYYDL